MIATSAPALLGESRIDVPAGEGSYLAEVSAAVEALRAGHPAIVRPDVASDGHGDLVLGAGFATEATINELILLGGGLIRVALSRRRIAGLGLARMDVAPGWRRSERPFLETVEAAEGTTTGISAADRARTIQVLANPASTRSDLNVPGHVVPLETALGGAEERAGSAELALELVRLAGLGDAAVCSEVLDEGGDSASPATIDRLASVEAIPAVGAEALLAITRRHGDGPLATAPVAADPHPETEETR